MSSTLDEFERINQLGVNLDDIKDDKYRVRNLIRDVHSDKDYINLKFYLLDKYDLWDKYIGG